MSTKGSVKPDGPPCTLKILRKMKSLPILQNQKGISNHFSSQKLKPKLFLLHRAPGEPARHELLVVRLGADVLLQRVEVGIERDWREPLRPDPGHRAHSQPTIVLLIVAGGPEEYRTHEVGSLVEVLRFVDPGKYQQVLESTAKIYSTGCPICLWIWVGLTDFGAPLSCTAAQTFLPNCYQPRQNARNAKLSD